MSELKALHLSSKTLQSPYFANLIQGLAEKGVSLVLASISEPQAPTWLSKIPGSRYVYLNAFTRSSYLAAMWRWVRLLREERVDIIQTHLFDAAIVGLLAARFAGKPLTVVARHHLDEPQILGKRHYVAMDRWISRTADCVVVPSRAVKDYIHTQERHTDDSIIVIPYVSISFRWTLMMLTDKELGQIRTRIEVCAGLCWTVLQELRTCLCLHRTKRTD